MRIVAGLYRSRILKGPKDNSIRPTSDKVKGAIFSSLGPKVNNGRFLDCYSGTGNMGLEALSRGMKPTMVDVNRHAISLIHENIQTLQVHDECQVIPMDIFAALSIFKEGFDVIYIDPPYAKQRNEELMSALLEKDLINDQGIVVVESLKSDNFSERIGSLEKIKEKVYRDTKITYYRKG